MKAMLQANHLFLALLPMILYHASSIPIVPTSGPECRISTPSNPQLQDLGCVRDSFDEAYSSLKAYYDNLQQPQCSPVEAIQHTLRKPLGVFRALQQNIRRLERINSSLINASYSELICRMKSSLLPSLNHTTTKLCECSTDGDCINSELTTDSTATVRDEDLTEFCVVKAIRVTLKNLLKRLEDDSRVAFTASDVQCRVNFTSRQQLVDLKERFSSLTFCPLRSPPVSSPNYFCQIREDLITLHEGICLLRNRTGLELHEVADDIEDAIPIFFDILEAQIAAGENCTLATNRMVEEGDSCLPEQLKRSYYSLVKVASRNMDLSCSIVYIEGVRSVVDKSTSEAPTHEAVKG